MWPVSGPAESLYHVCTYQQAKSKSWAEFDSYKCLLRTNILQVFPPIKYIFHRPHVAGEQSSGDLVPCLHLQACEQ